MKQIKITATKVDEQPVILYEAPDFIFERFGVGALVAWMMIDCINHGGHVEFYLDGKLVTYPWTTE